MTLTIPEARSLGYEIVKSDGDRWYIDKIGGDLLDRSGGYGSRRHALERLTQRLADDDAFRATVDHAIVDVTEIARRLNTTPGTVHQWRRRHATFPEPAQMLAIGPVWFWPDVERWAAVPRRRTGRPTQ